jgi:hypothetical protein
MLNLLEVMDPAKHAVLDSQPRAGSAAAAFRSNFLAKHFPERQCRFVTFAI